MDTPDPTQSKNALIAFLSICFFISAIALILLQSKLDVNPTLEILSISLSFAMTGSLILFHFFNSSAVVKRREYELGGAAAGFVIIFGFIYYGSRGSFLDEAAHARLIKSPIATKLEDLAISRMQIASLSNEPLTKTADSKLDKLVESFRQLSQGTYEINSDEMSSYLMPLIKNSKQSFHAIQYVLPSRFWGQYWANAYFEENVKAVKRGVDVLRIFIIDPADTDVQQETIDALIRKHLDAGVPIRIIDRMQYLREHNDHDEDLRDFLIADNKLSGLLILNKGGGFNTVQFSINSQRVDEVNRNFDRLLSVSMSYDAWVRRK